MSNYKNFDFQSKSVDHCFETTLSKKKLCGIKNKNLQNVSLGPESCDQETEMNDKAFFVNKR